MPATTAHLAGEAVEETPSLTFISREEARAQGLKRFYTGEPCKHLHALVNGLHV
jgi:hypothetical protein